MEITSVETQMENLVHGALQEKMNMTCVTFQAVERKLWKNLSQFLPHQVVDLIGFNAGLSDFILLVL